MNEQLKDLAWAGIPPEVRKEIKFEYAFSDNKEILGDIFGHHNLTSDEEPDLPDQSEPKPTPKFKVGDIAMVANGKYKGESCEIYDIDESDVETVYQTSLYDSGGNYVWLSESDLTPYTEPEPKYKTGDKVRILECGRIGYVAVVQISDDGYVYELTDSNSRLIGIYNATEIEPYTEPEPQQTEERNEERNEETMEEKELKLLTLLKGCENETIYMPDEGLCKITQVLDDSITVFVKGKSWATSLKGETLEIKTTGFAYIYPSKESFLKYPLEAAKAWSEWKSEREPKYHIDAQLLLFEEGSLIDNINICDIKFKSLEVAKQAAEAVKRTLMEFHEKN